MASFTAKDERCLTFFAHKATQIHATNGFEQVYPITGQIHSFNSAYNTKPADRTFGDFNGHLNQNFDWRTWFNSNFCAMFGGNYSVTNSNR